MMSQVIRQETAVFLMSVCHGILLSFLYDVIRSCRRVFAHGIVLVSVEDFFFWLAAGFLTFCLLFLETDGEIRGYVTVGIGMGVTLYLLALSRLVLYVLTTVLGKLRAAGKWLSGTVKKIFGRLSGIVKKSFGRLSGMVKKGFGRLSGMVKKGFGRLSGMMKKSFGRLSGMVKKSFARSSGALKKDFDGSQEALGEEFDGSSGIRKESPKGLTGKVRLRPGRKLKKRIEFASERVYNKKERNRKSDRKAARHRQNNRGNADGSKRKKARKQKQPQRNARHRSRSDVFAGRPADSEPEVDCKKQRL